MVMRYTLMGNAVTKINETSGIIQNVSSDKIEVADNAEMNGAYMLQPLNKLHFSGATIYLRIRYAKKDTSADVRVITFGSSGISGGTSSGGNIVDFVDDESVAADADVDDYFDSIFGGNG